jgi:hypothetical protein
MRKQTNKTIRLTESDLYRIVRRVINEQDEYYGGHIDQKGSLDSRGRQTGRNLQDFSSDEFSTDVFGFGEDWDDLIEKYPGIEQWWGSGGKEAYLRWMDKYGPLVIKKRR